MVVWSSTVYGLLYFGVVYIYVYHPDYFLESYYGRRAPFLFMGIVSMVNYPYLGVEQWDRMNQDNIFDR